MDYTEFMLEPHGAGTPHERIATTCG